MKVFYIFFLILLSNCLEANEYPFVLYTSLYNETNPQRQNEYLYCLQKNLAHPSIKEIVVYYDQSKDHLENSVILDYLKNAPVKLFLSEGRPTYHHLLAHANEEYPNHNIMISNGDIFFDETLELIHSISLKNKFICLSRWDMLSETVTESHPFHNDGVPAASFDVWIFQTPIVNFDDVGIYLGTQHCDGYIAYRAYRANYQVFNPCLSIICHHYHLSGIRNWGQPYRPSMSGMLVPWCSLDNIIYANAAHIWHP